MSSKTNSQYHRIPEYHNEMERSFPSDIRAYSRCSAGEECNSVTSRGTEFLLLRPPSASCETLGWKPLMQIAFDGNRR